MSERKAAEAADRYRASLVAHVSDAIVGYRRRRTDRELERGSRSIYGWKEQEVAGMSISAVVTANRTDSAAVLEAGHRSIAQRTAPEVDVLSPSTRSSTTTPSLRLGGVCTSDRMPPGRSRPPGRRGALRAVVPH